MIRNYVLFATLTLTLVALMAWFKGPRTAFESISLSDLGSPGRDVAQ